MPIQEDVLSVCLFVKDEDSCQVVCNQIASGHVFGENQRIKLLLHGLNEDSIQDLVTSLEECCYPLLNDVCSLSSSSLDQGIDVAILLLCNNHAKSTNYKRHFSQAQTTSLSLRKQSEAETRRRGETSNSNVNQENNIARGKIIDFVTAISNIYGNSLHDNSKVLVVGHEANLAATLLSHAVNSKGGNQVLAFEHNNNDEISSSPLSRTKGRGQYKLAESLRHVVSQWWTGAKISSDTALSVGVKVFWADKKGGERSPSCLHRTGCFINAHVDIIGPKTVRTDFNRLGVDGEQIQRVIQQTENVFKQMSMEKKTQLNLNYFNDNNSSSKDNPNHHHTAQL